MAAHPHSECLAAFATLRGSKVYRNILVPIDGSACAGRGLNEATKIAAIQGSRIRLIHVLNQSPLASPQVTGSKFDQVFEQLREYGRMLLSAAQSSVIDAGIQVDSKLVDISGGDVGERIVEEASAWPADLIVCGTHGRRGLRRIVMGSAAEHVVRLSSVPVLLVPAGAGGS